MFSKVKTNELINMAQCLSSLLYSCENMPGKVQYAIDKNMRMLEPLIQDVEKSRDEIIKKYATLDEEGNFMLNELENGMQEYIYADDESKEKALKEVKELMETPCSVSIHQIKLSDYSDVVVDTKKVVFPNILFDKFINEDE